MKQNFVERKVKWETIGQNRILKEVGDREASASLMQHIKQVTFRPTETMVLGAYWGLEVRWAGEGVKLHAQMVV